MNALKAATFGWLFFVFCLQSFDQRFFTRNTYAMRPTTVTINLSHVMHNYKLLQQHATSSSVMAVVKANAYGHGLLQVSEALYDADCRSFAVTDPVEGVQLRVFFAGQGKNDAKIIILSGFFDQNGAKLCQKHDLVPVLSEKEQCSQLKTIGYTGAVWLKVDTGMQRIGAVDVVSFVASISRSGMQLVGIMSHMACADTPDHQLNRKQIQRFKVLQQQYPDLPSSLFNSAGLIAFSHVIHTAVVRPGIALYGAEPIPSMPLGLKPVMQLSASIIQVREIQAGESVSYGATWVAKKPMHIAVVTMGYADGLSRLLSNRGEVFHRSGRLPIVGRVCMDYCMLAVDAKQVHVGDEVIFFGFSAGAPHVNDVAQACQSISYECLTSISMRVPRVYIEESV